VDVAIIALFRPVEHFDDDDNDAVYSEIETMEIKALLPIHTQTN